MDYSNGYRSDAYKDMSIEEFDKLAKDQSKLYPDMLYFMTEDKIVEMFYDIYSRKKPNEID